jgi:hypothetical protein
VRPLTGVMNDKILEEFLKALITLAVGGIVYWIGKIFSSVADAKVKETNLNRDLQHMKRALESQSLILTQIDGKLDVAEDRAAELDKRISILEVYTKHSNSGFQRVIVGADKNVS